MQGPASVKWNDQRFYHTYHPRLSNPLFSAPPEFTLCLGPLMVFLAMV